MIGYVAARVLTYNISDGMPLIDNFISFLMVQTTIICVVYLLCETYIKHGSFYVLSTCNILNDRFLKQVNAVLLRSCACIDIQHQ